MTTITSHADTAEYDAEIAAQDSDDLLSDLDALRANLRRKSFSSIPACDQECRATFTRWHTAIIAELTRRGVPVPPERKRKTA